MGNIAQHRINLAKYRLRMKKALRRRYIPIYSSMSTNTLSRLIKVFKITVE